MSFSITGDTATGSTAVTSLSSTTGLLVGMEVVGTGIPDNSVITSINTGSSLIVISNPATADGTGVSLTIDTVLAASVNAVASTATLSIVNDLALDADIAVKATTTFDLTFASFPDLFASIAISGVSTAALSSEYLLSASITVSANVAVDLAFGTELTAAIATAGTATADLEVVTRQLFDAIELYVDVTTRQLVSSLSGYAATGKMVVKRADKPLVRVWFIKGSNLVSLPEETTVKLGVKKAGNYSALPIVQSSDMNRYLDDSGVAYYETTLDLTTLEVFNLFPANEQVINCIGEIEASTPSLTAVISSQEFPVEIWNDIIRDDFVGTPGTPFTMKTGDLLPALEAILEDENGPVDLTGATVDFIFATSGNVEIFRRSATIVSAVDGHVKYEWQAGDTDTAGDFRAEFESDNGPQTFPNDGYIPILILDDLG